MLRAGELRQSVIIQRQVTSDNGRGGQDVAWTILAIVRAKVVAQSGREAVIARSLQGIETYRIWMRWRSDRPAVADRILYDGRELNIRTVEDPDGRREQLVILADTESPQGGM